MLSSFQSPGEIAFSIFGFPIYYYGVILAFAIFVGVYLADFLYKKFYDKTSYIIDFMPMIIFIGILGARLYYCAVNYQYYFDHPMEILYIRQGGLSIHGMIIFGIIALFVFSKIYKMKFFKLTDVFLCGSALAQSIGRWGNFFNSEAFGYPTDLPWKLYIPISHRPVELVNYDYFHPTFLYESILDFCMFLILLFMFKKRVPAGVITCSYLILYSIVRFVVEYFRIDSVLNISGIPIAQIVSVVMFAIGVTTMRFILRFKI